MTTRPHLLTARRQLVGLIAVALFGVMSAVFLTAEFGPAATFGGAQHITAAIGYAIFNFDAGSLPSEGFLVPFEIIDVVLVAALAAAVMLARREEPTRLLSDGGRGDGPAARDDEGSDDGGDA